jgi:peptidylprolyl isomerase
MKTRRTPLRTAAFLSLLAPLALAGAQAQTTPPSTTTPPSATSQTTPAHHTSTAASRARAAAAAKAKAAADESPALPPGVPPAPGKLETAFSLRYIDTKVGDGAEVQPGDYITVQYTGWLASDGTKFDSSLDHGGAPFTFPQGMHRVIAGWDQGFAGMRVGGKRRLFIPYQLAYGDNGRPPIPPKSDLIFDIELVSSGSMPPAPAAPPPPPQPGGQQ